MRQLLLLHAFRKLERLEKRQEGVAFGWIQFIKAPFDFPCFAFMPFNSVFE